MTENGSILLAIDTLVFIAFYAALVLAVIAAVIGLLMWAYSTIQERHATTVKTAPVTLELTTYLATGNEAFEVKCVQRGMTQGVIYGPCKDALKNLPTFGPYTQDNVKQAAEQMAAEYYGKK